MARRLRAQAQRLVVDATHGRDPASGLPLPPRLLRAGGRHFRADAAFLAGARRDAQRLVELGRLGPDTRLLDLGCGAGRLAIGIRAEVGTIRAYCGIDVDRSAIGWCTRHLTARDAALRFHAVDVRNARYNPAGAALDERFRLPVDDASVDTVHAYSLFSHMVAEDVRAYLGEIARALDSGGGAVFTAFVEDGVADQAVNPSGYGPRTWRGALHCVRFDRAYFEDLLADAGLAVVTFRHGGETDGQSLYAAVPAAH